jgi:hypothetical protein
MEIRVKRMKENVRRRFFMSAKIIHTACDDTEGDDRGADDGEADDTAWMTAERMTQQGCDDQRSWMTIYD